MKHKLILTIFTLALIFTYGYIYTISQKNYNLNVKFSSDVPKDYLFKSEVLKFSIKVPYSLKVRDDDYNVDLITDEGEISISSIGTYFKTSKEHLEYSDKMNNRNSVDITTVPSKKYDIIRAKLINIDNKDWVTYYINLYPAVYTFQTTSPELYDELEQVVMSFEYTGQ